MGGKHSVEGRSVVGSTWMSGLRLRVVSVWAAVCARCVALVQIYNTAFGIECASRPKLPKWDDRSGRDATETSVWSI